MDVEFSLPDDELHTTVATAVWDGHSVAIAADDEALRAKLVKAFRPTPVVVDDPAYRRLGTHGTALVAPGDLEWFRAVAQVRAPAEAGVHARLVPGVRDGGFDPAAGYRGFGEQLERLDERTRTGD